MTFFYHPYEAPATPNDPLLSSQLVIGGTGHWDRVSVQTVFPQRLCLKVRIVPTWVRPGILVTLIDGLVTRTLPLYDQDLLQRLDLYNVHEHVWIHDGVRSLMPAVSPFAIPDDVLVTHEFSVVHDPVTVQPETPALPAGGHWNPDHPLEGGQRTCKPVYVHSVGPKRRWAVERETTTLSQRLRSGACAIRLLFYNQSYAYRVVDYERIGAMHALLHAIPA